MRFREGDREAFSRLFEMYYTDLVLYCGSFIKSRERCEDIVQDVFVKMWAERDNMTVRSTLKYYLLRSVRNSFIDEVRHSKVELRYQADLSIAERSNSLDTMNYVLYSDAEESVRKALATLSRDEREVFISSRYHHLKYEEIAKKMSISVRTVEVRMSKAVNKLKTILSSLAIFLTGIFS